MEKRFEGKSLEEAFELASKELGCSIDRLDYDIIQYPSKGLLGLFAKKAIILVKSVKNNKEISKTEDKKEDLIDNSVDSSIEKDIMKKDKIEKVGSNIDDTEVLDSFYGKNRVEKKAISATELEIKIKKLFESSCFDIDTIEVDIEDNTAYVFIDGVDAALLIGKEGYRYNALSYLLFNWINSKYGLYLKLEIAQFLASQQDMIVNQLKPVVEHIHREGWGRTRELNGILVQIALEYLRDTFPNKYVAIKKAKNGEKYIIVNDFNKR